MKPADPRAVKAWDAHRPRFFTEPSKKHIRALAQHIGVTQPAVSKWPQVPERHVHTVAAFLGVTPSDLRPDLYSPEPWSAL